MNVQSDYLLDAPLFYWYLILL